MKNNTVSACKCICHTFTLPIKGDPTHHCCNNPHNHPTEPTVTDENTFTQPSGDKCRCRKGPFHYATKREREYIPKSTRAWGGTWVCENCGGYKYDM